MRIVKEKGVCVGLESAWIRVELPFNTTCSKLSLLVVQSAPYSLHTYIKYFTLLRSSCVWRSCQSSSSDDQWMVRCSCRKVGRHPLHIDPDNRSTTHFIKRTLSLIQLCYHIIECLNAVSLLLHCLCYVLCLIL